MAKILLLDFESADLDKLVLEDYDVDLMNTGWTSESGAGFSIPEDSEMIFYRIDSESPEDKSALHGDVHEELTRRVMDGAQVVCFIGEGKPFQLKNIVGPIAGLDLRADARPDMIRFNPRVLFHVPLERYRPSISKAWKLVPEAFAEGVWEKDTAADGKVEILAKSGDGYPVAALLRRGTGHFLLLPSFGEKNVEIVEYLLKDKMSFSGFSRAALEERSWIDGEEYVFPELKSLMAKKNEEMRRHEDALAAIDTEISKMKAGGQEEFHKLLKAEGPELTAAVLNAFSYLGYGKVVDVDKYWKNVIRNKEEDIWLIEVAGQPVETCLRMESLILVLVGSNKNWATDDECLLLQKFKGRRMQEFDNTKMKAVLVGNYFSATDPKERATPFSSVQIEETQKDGNGLLTTYELFKAVKAEKENKVAKDKLRAQLGEKTGLITFDI